MAEKRKGESFSEVVKRLAEKRPLTSFAGAWSDLGEEKVEEIKNILKKEREISLARKRSPIQGDRGEGRKKSYDAHISG